MDEHTSHELAYKKGYAEGHEKGYKEGFLRGLEDGTPKWIPVTERLPEYDGEYLTIRTFDDGTRFFKIIDFAKNGIDVWGGDFDGEENVFYYYYGGDCVLADNITHWMPLPEPPKGE